ncbi:molybdopterin-synthase adenylyltransferase MoeB [Coralliovum pocilloporae]|uniref:molybdopterin-synthase adenylyltransferase MoeB n=1 Tax=Coralliovum pocilloporae TaxID=3066369 RepID=UPI0033071BE6
MMLNSDELERYARHIVLHDVGGPGQQKLKAARVLVIGAGGLGAPIIAYLAAAGVGTIGIADDDIVSLSNLQRQVIHDTDKVDVLKVESAKAAVKRLNPNVTVEAHPFRLSEENARSLISQYDLIVEGSDNFETRYIASDAAELEKKPLITAAVGRFDGSITTLKPYERDRDGRLNPRYRDLFPDMPAPGSIPSCSEAGVLGALTGVIGSMQALEVIKEIVGIGDGLVGKLLLYDSLSCRFQTITYKRPA